MLDRVVADLLHEFGDDLVGLLLGGSAATGRMRPESDLDLYALIRPRWRRRRTRWVDGVEVEIFINPPARIAAEIHDSQSATTDMFARGVALYDPEGVVASLAERAREVVAAGTPEPGAMETLLHRYLPDDLLKDVRDAARSDRPTADLLIGMCVRAAVEAHYSHLRRRRPKPADLLDDLAEAAPHLASPARAALEPGRDLTERITSLEELVAGAIAPLGGALGEWQSPRQAIGEDGSVGDVID